MVGIVVVSHSRALARAAVALAEEMLQGRPLAIVIAAGLDEDTFGTDAVAIHDALVEADDGDGVVVLMDLGSAVLSAELALELLADDEARERVLLCPAPLVEGLVVAAVTAVSGAGRAEVAAEASAALAGKQSQLGGSSPIVENETRSGDGESARFVVGGEHGLHARPAARLVALLRDLDAQVELRNISTDSGWVSGASLSRVATLGALKGHEVAVRASGRQGHEAVEQVLALARRNFDEAVAGPGAGIPSTTGDGPFAASPGIGIGPARQASASVDVTDVPQRRTKDASVEQKRLDGAIAAVRVEIQALRGRVAGESGASGAEIFDAHLALLDDPELLAGARNGIDAGLAASSGWAAAVTAVMAGFEALTDAYLRARADDVRAVGDQVLAHLLDLGSSSPAAGRSGVLVSADLTPAQAATLDIEKVAAVVLAFGSPTAHSAILARTRGIPALVGAGAEVLKIPEGTPLAVDGTTGELVIDPSEAVLATFRERAAAAKDRRREARARSDGPAVTRDGVEVLVGANVGSIEDAQAAAAAGADLVGLVRTEFLFLGREQAPDVDEQEHVYRAVAEALGGRRVTLRTLDVGGDKPLAYLPMPAEANPFLGVRGLRVARQHPQLLSDQLLAMVRVAHDFPVSVMFPMVSTLAELIAARAVLAAAITEVGRGEPAGLQVGIMVEVPAAALKSAGFAPHVDFFSIGTNDLTQYTLAAERGNDAVAALGDPLDPGVLHLIEATCRGAGAGPPVAVCGELAADERAAALLVGLGVRELSVNPRAVPGVKQAVRELDSKAAESLAGRALSLASADAVRELLR